MPPAPPASPGTTRRGLLALGVGGLLGCSGAPEPAQRWLEPLATDAIGAVRPLRMAPGRFGLVHVWARWCAPCRRELPSLQHQAPRYGEHGVDLQLLALEDDPFALREYLAGLAFTLPVWRVSALPAGLAPPGLPMTMVVDPQGWIVRRHLGAQAWDRPERWLPGQAWPAT